VSVVADGDAGQAPLEREAAATRTLSEIRAAGIVKRYGHRFALSGLDLLAQKGERIGLLGANGAGKTTLIRILALLTRPDLGSVEICGLQASSHAREIRARVGVCLHDSLLYSDLTVTENIRFFGGLYGVRDLEGMSHRVLERFALLRLAATRVRHLSRGQRQRASLARALVHDPPVLLLDEPDTGQDRASLDRITEELSADAGRTIVFATHQPHYALALATRLALLERGRARDLGMANALTPGDLEAELRNTASLIAPA
jgi:ABC-type multidrug transport system ATPase subunit